MKFWHLALVQLLLLLGCTQTQPPNTPVIVVETPTGADTQTPTTAASEPTPLPTTILTEGGYPLEIAPTPASPYPEPIEERLAEPPDPERVLPQAASETGVVGGTLIREFINDGTYLPFDPHELILAEVVTDSEGNPGFIRYNEASPRAETFTTGVFIFHDVPPGEYGLVVNMAFTEFAVLNVDGNQLLITVNQGDVVDLEQVIVALP